MNEQAKENKAGWRIEIHWSDSKLEKACSNEKAGKKRWGANFRTLQKRLDSLDAAETLADMEGIPGRCHALRGDRAGQFAVSLWGSYRLVFVVANDPVPLLEDGGIDRSKVTVITLVEVVDYHGD